MGQQLKIRLKRVRRKQYHKRLKERAKEGAVTKQEPEATD